MKKLFLSTCMAIAFVACDPTSHDYNEQLLLELKIVKQELHLLNEQINGINRNLRNLGIFYAVKPKEDR